jgi:hypothetical protein
MPHAPPQRRPGVTPLTPHPNASQGYKSSQRGGHRLVTAGEAEGPAGQSAKPHNGATEEGEGGERERMVPMCLWVHSR